MKAGIWMDHASAEYIQYTKPEATGGRTDHVIINSEYQLPLGGGEKLENHKEQNRQGAFYRQLAELITGLEEVLLFGPTEAKTELLNMLRRDHRFDKVVINVKPTDKLTGNQRFAFVNDYFA